MHAHACARTCAHGHLTLIYLTPSLLVYLRPNHAHKPAHEQFMNKMSRDTAHNSAHDIMEPFAKRQDTKCASQAQKALPSRDFPSPGTVGAWAASRWRQHSPRAGRKHSKLCQRRAELKISRSRSRSRGVQESNTEGGGVSRRPHLERAIWRGQAAQNIQECALASSERHSPAMRPRLRVHLVCEPDYYYY